MLALLTADLTLAKESVANHAEQIENLNKLLLVKGEEVASLKQKLEEGGSILSFLLAS